MFPQVFTHLAFSSSQVIGLLKGTFKDTDIARWIMATWAVTNFCWSIAVIIVAGNDPVKLAVR